MARGVKRLRRFGLVFAGALLALCALVAPASAQVNAARYLELTGFLDEPSIDFVVREVRAAQQGSEAALILRIDSPGSVGASIEPALDAVRSSRVPVIVWVAAGEARAGSGAALLALSGDHVVMSPGATIGPALPLDLAAADEPGADAHRSLLARVAADSKRDLAPDALGELERNTVPAERARELGLVDGIEPNVQELLLSLKGETVRSGAASVTFSEDPFTLRFVKMGLMERLVHSAIRPEFAYLLLLFGIFGLIFELYNPGIGAAALSGGVALLFSFYAFTELPTNWWAVAAILGGLALLGLDMKIQSLGPYSIGGLVALGAGSLGLYSGASPDLRLPLWTSLLGIAMTLSFFIQVMTSAIRARTARPLPAADGIMGAVGVARTDISPDGQVMARGTLWRARTLGAAIGEGTAVKIKGVSGLMLMVEPTSEKPEDG